MSAHSTASSFLVTRFGELAPRRRTLVAWAAVGAAIHASTAGLHGLVTPVGPIALWLWLLPLAALGLDLLLMPDAGPDSAVQSSGSRRRRRVGQGMRLTGGRRDRVRPQARPDRKMG